MRTMNVTSQSKINITLDVLSNRQKSGYHRIQTIFQQISLKDEIEFEMLNSDKIEFDCTFVPLKRDFFRYQQKMQVHPMNNTLVKAAVLLKALTGEKRGVRIDLKKKIPLESGLGGGSGNAAASLLALNALWALGLSPQDLSKIALQLGMDTTFFLTGSTALGKHFGEEITPLPSLKRHYLVLVFPGISVSSTWAYAKIDSFEAGKNKNDTSHLIQQIRSSGGLISDFSLLHNDFDLICLNTFPIIRTIFDKLDALSAQAFHVCGSGGGVYGIFDDELKRDRAMEGMKDLRCAIVTAETAHNGSYEAS